MNLTYGPVFGSWITDTHVAQALEACGAHAQQMCSSADVDRFGLAVYITEVEQNKPFVTMRSYSRPDMPGACVEGSVWKQVLDSRTVRSGNIPLSVCGVGTADEVSPFIKGYICIYVIGLPRKFGRALGIAIHAMIMAYATP